MKKAKHSLLGIALIGMAVGAAGLRGDRAEAVVLPASVYEPAQAISQNFGSKHAVGYFLKRDGACAITVFISESSGEDTPPPATRFKITVKPGEKAEFASVEMQTLELACVSDAAEVEARNGNFQKAYVTR